MDSPNFPAEFNAKLKKFSDRMRHLEKTGTPPLTQRQGGKQSSSSSTPMEGTTSGRWQTGMSGMEKGSITTPTEMCSSGHSGTRSSMGTVGMRLCRVLYIPDWGIL